MKKRILSLLLAAVMLCAFVPAASAEESSGSLSDTVSWSLDASGTLTITGSGPIPDEASYEYWWDLFNSITAVSIGEGITSIGQSAFGDCSALTSVVIPGSVTSIGNSAFYGCSALTSVVIPEGISEIGRMAFAYCRSLSSISLPKSLTSIGRQAIYGIANPCDVYYAGSEADWASVTLESSDSLQKKRVVMHYNSSGGTDTPAPVPGDMDGSGALNLSDVSMLYHAILSRASLNDSIDRGDVNGDGLVNLRDVAALFALCNK